MEKFFNNLQFEQSKSYNWNKIRTQSENTIASDEFEILRGDLLLKTTGDQLISKMKKRQRLQWFFYGQKIVIFQETYKTSI